MKIKKKIRRVVARAVRELRLSFGLFSDNVEVTSCPVCNYNKLTKTFVHKEWLKQCYTCDACMHSFLPDINNVVPDNYFVTYKPRAKIYADIVSSLDINSLIEIGVPDDFFFLKCIHELRPDIKLYGYDIIKKNKVPPYVTMMRDLTPIDVDFVYATHVLEHFSNPGDLLKYIKDGDFSFIVEVPNCPSSYAGMVQNSRHGTGYHYHFFNIKSLDQLLANWGIKALIFVRKDADSERNIRGSLVASNIKFNWKKYVHSGYQVINRLE